MLQFPFCVCTPTLWNAAKTAPLYKIGLSCHLSHSTLQGNSYPWHVSYKSFLPTCSMLIVGLWMAFKARGRTVVLLNKQLKLVCTQAPTPTCIDAHTHHTHPPTPHTITQREIYLYPCNVKPWCVVHARLV